MAEQGVQMNLALVVGSWNESELPRRRMQLRKDSPLNENLDTIKGGVNSVKDLCLLQSCVASLLYVPF